MCEKLERIEEIKEQIMKLNNEMQFLKDEIVRENCAFSVGDIVKIVDNCYYSGEKYWLQKLYQANMKLVPVIFAKKPRKSGKYGVEKEVWQLSLYGAEKCV
jgi:hypothetical protein